MKKLLFILLFVVQAQAQTFDFRCIPQDLLDTVEDFFADAKAHGLPFNRNRGTLLYQDIPTDGVAGRATYCVYDYVVIIDSEWWEDPNNPDWLKRTVVYHEYGHALLYYSHNCDLHRIRGREIPEIMWTGACSSSNRYFSRHNVEEDWDILVDRFFDQSIGNPRHTCSGKGAPQYIDN